MNTYTERKERITIMEEKKTYTEMDLEVIFFENEDVITTSPNPGGSDDGQVV